MPTKRIHPVLRGATALVVTAHPDDESYLAAGTIDAIRRSGGSVHLVCATHGEKGMSHLKRPVPGRVLAKRRARELHAAGKILGVTSIRILRHPDGNAGANPEKFFRSTRAVAKRVQPTVIMGFGPDGITGHLDHVAVGRTARRLARSLNLPFIRFSLPPKVVANALQFLYARRRSPRYAKHVRYDRPNFSVSITPRVKIRAIRCHASQMDGTNAYAGFPDFAVRELLRREYFVLESPRKSNKK